MYQKANQEIREKAKAAGIPLWRVAEALGVSEPTIIRTLRHELPDGGERAPAPPHRKIVDDFNAICISLPKVQQLTDKRRAAIKSAMGMLGKTTWAAYWQMVEVSDFLTGRANSSGRQWRADFDWLLKPSNMAKVVFRLGQTERNSRY